MNNRRAAAAIVLAGVLASCARAGTGEAPGPQPARVEHHRVVLTADAMRRLGIRTVPVTRATVPGSHRDRTTIPYAAVIYRPDGSTWAYTVVGRREFARARIQIDHITGKVAVLTAGPRPGTPVVTVGGAELYGIEVGVAEE